MVHFELPPECEVDPYTNFYLDWDAHNNNEPYYTSFRRQSIADLCEEAGFGRENYIQQQLFNLGTVPQEQFDACARGEIEAPVILNGGSWFTFGAWK